MRCSLFVLITLLGTLRLLLAACASIRPADALLFSPHNTAGSAAAWGVTGHYVVADVAWGLMDTDVREVRLCRVRIISCS